MKKLIELGQKQSVIVNNILKEESLYKPKLASKFAITEVGVGDDVKKYYLCVDGKLDTTYYGCLLYRLGLEMSKG